MRIRNALLGRPFSLFNRRTHSILASQQSLNAAENQTVSILTQQLHIARKLLTKMSAEFDGPRDKFDIRINRQLALHAPTVLEEHQLLIKQKTELLDALQEVLKSLNQKQKEVEDKNAAVEEEIKTLVKDLEIIDHELKELKIQFGYKHSGEFQPLRDYDKEGPLALELRFQLYQSCEMISAISAATGRKNTLEDELISQIMLEHGTDSYARLHLQIAYNKSKLSEKTKTLAILTEEHHVLATKLHVLSKQIPLVEAQISHCHKAVKQLNEIDEVESEKETKKESMASINSP